jgi:UDP-galactopyranose mutase
MTNIVIETQEEFYKYMHKIKEGCQTIADNLREDRIGEAMNLISHFTEGVSWALQVIALMNGQKYEINIDTSRINEFLLEINEGLERQDFVIVADMFEYEIQPFFEEAKEKRFEKVGE